jgi:hypothetical protein
MATVTANGKYKYDKMFGQKPPLYSSLIRNNYSMNRLYQRLNKTMRLIPVADFIVN